MAASRYWRLIGIETYAGGDLELSELHLYDATGRVDASATLSCSHAPTAGTLADLKDGDTSTVCRFSGGAVRSAGFWFQWDCGGSTPAAVGVRLGSAAVPDNFLVAATLEFSSDGRAWAFAQTFNRFAWPGPISLTQTPRAGDADYQSDSLLLHCDGDTGSKSFLDFSPNIKSVAAVGNAHIDTSESVFGGASGYLDGIESYLQVSPSADMAFGAGDLTIEGRFRVASFAKQRTLFDFRPIDTNGPYIFMAVKTTGAVFLYVDGSERIVSSASAVSAGTWVNIALSRVGGTTRLFVGGALVGSPWADGTSYGTGATFSCRIGRSSVAAFSEEFEGHFDEICIKKGVGRYSGNFTPSVWPFAHAVIGATDGYLPPLISAPGNAAVNMARDIEFGGAGIIYGTTKIKGTPNAPTKARVVLLHQRSKLPVRETWSDEVTGMYVFQGLDTKQEFLALVELPSGAFAPLAASRITPSI